MKQLIIRPNFLFHRCTVLNRALSNKHWSRHYGISYSQVRHIVKEHNTLRKLIRNYDPKILRRPEPSSGLCCCYSTGRGNNSAEKEQEPEKDEDLNNERNINAGLFLCSCLLALLGIYYKLKKPATESPVMTFAQFEEKYLKHGRVKNVDLYSSYNNREAEIAVVTLHPSTSYDWQSQKTSEVVVEMKSVGLFQELLQSFESTHNVAVHELIPVRRRPGFSTYDQGEVMTNQILISAAFIFLVFLIRVYRRVKIRTVDFKPLNLWNSDFKITRGDKLMKNKFSFKEIVGMHEPKKEVLQFVDYLKNPGKFQELGAKIPTGALLLGPPGCGKTLLAKALAGECDVPYYFYAGSEFRAFRAGEGAAKVRALFKEARENAPCIIYIDEIDAVGGNRSDSERSRDQELNQLLVELDGMHSRKDVVVIASTNKAEKLDKALLRPGRLDRHINVDLPTMPERVELFDLYLGKLTLANPASTYSTKLAQLTPGMSGADIANICNEAAIHASRNVKKAVTAEDFEYAMERVIAGAAKKKSGTLAPHERKTIAYHEAGHALVSWLLEHTDPLLKVTIVPRANNIGGFAQYLPKERQLFSKEELFERMCVGLGGRIAESLILHSITTGAHDDLQKVTNLAYAQLMGFGMSKNIGLLAFPLEDDGSMKPYSKKYKNAIDLEARQIVLQAQRRTEELLTENADKLHKLANLLLEKDTVSATDVEKVIGPPPFRTEAPIDQTSLYEEELTSDKTDKTAKDNK